MLSQRCLRSFRVSSWLQEQAKAAKDIQYAKEKQKQLLDQARRAMQGVLRAAERLESGHDLQVIQKSMDVRTGQARRFQLQAVHTLASRGSTACVTQALPEDVDPMAHALRGAGADPTHIKLVVRSMGSRHSGTRPLKRRCCLLRLHALGHHMTWQEHFLWHPLG